MKMIVMSVMDINYKPFTLQKKYNEMKAPIMELLVVLGRP